MHQVRDLRLCMAIPENLSSQGTLRCCCQGLLYIFPSDFLVQQSKNPNISLSLPQAGIFLLVRGLFNSEN